MAIERVLVYPDDTIPEDMLEVYRIGGVETWETGGVIKHYPELIDNRPYNSSGEMLDIVTQQLGVDRSIVELDGPQEL
jgi:hypothetical protein